MNKPLFLQYPKCGTCRKAAKWLKDNNIEVTSRDISLDNPNEEELSVWIGQSGLPVAKFFNTSGKIYKEQNLKETVKTAPNNELISLLATNGMLVKRPIVVAGKNILVGFEEEEWTKLLK